MLFKIPNIFVYQRLIPLDDQQILSILLFRSFRKVERASDKCVPVDNDYLVVRYGVLVVDEDSYTSVDKKRCSGIPFFPLAFVKDSNYRNTAFLGVQKSFRNGFGSKTVCLDEYLLPGFVDFIDDSVSGSTVRREKYLFRAG